MDGQKETTWIFNTICFTIIALIFVFSDIAEAKDYSAYRDDCEPLREIVEPILKQVGISTDYFYLMAAESHCHADRVSSAGAVGVWQLMPRTSRKYGCESPEDIECATKAAASYLKHLEEKCGKENVIYCWHDGGTNFLRKGKPTKGAEALYWQFRYFMRTDNP